MWRWTRKSIGWMLECQDKHRKTFGRILRSKSAKCTDQRTETRFLRPFSKTGSRSLLLSITSTNREDISRGLDPWSKVRRQNCSWRTFYWYLPWHQDHPKVCVFHETEEKVLIPSANVSLVIQDFMRKTPSTLPACLWEPLREHGFVLRPEEYRCKLLDDTPVSMKSTTIYPEELIRKLRAAMALDPRTQESEFIFKCGESAELDFLLKSKNVLINYKLFDFEGGYQSSSCWLASKHITEHLYPCDHTIINLHRLILDKINKNCELDQEIRADSGINLGMELEDSLRYMPRMIKVQHGWQIRELEVLWSDQGSHFPFHAHGQNLKRLVTLHRENTCLRKRQDLLLCYVVIQNSIVILTPSLNLILDELECGSSGIADCECPHQTASQKAGRGVFTNLNRKHSYFPMINRDYRRAFFGSPPPAVCPEVASGFVLGS